MMFCKRYFLSLCFILVAANYLQAQNITGTWEGDLEHDEFIRLVIIQNGNKVCGYTMDYVKAEKTSHCKAYFDGTWDKNRKRLNITGRKFIENSGSHVFMRLNLSYKTEKGEEMLQEFPSAGKLLLNMMSTFGTFGTFSDDPFPQQSSNMTVQYVNMKKMSDKPLEILDAMKDCLDPKALDSLLKPKDSLPEVKLVEPEIRKDSLPAIAKVITPEKQKDTPVRVAPVIVTKEIPSISNELKKRKNVEQSHLEINVKTINIKVYDNAIVDGDTISLLYNGRMLLTHQLLSEKGIELNLDLDENQTRHELTLFAENLGTIPPNTALIVITAGKKRYELFASASLEENAILVFDYKPDK